MKCQGNVVKRYSAIFLSVPALNGITAFKRPLRSSFECLHLLIGESLLPGSSSGSKSQDKE